MAEEIANYIEDDWEDNSLTARSNPEKGLYYSYSDGGTGDLLKGVYRPKWTVTRGNSSKINASNGELVIESTGDDNNVCVATPSNISIGEWVFDYHHDDARYGGFAFISTGDVHGGVPQYRVITTDSTYSSDRLQKDTGSSATNLIDYGSSGAFTETWRITRNSYGNIEWLRDGQSVGTTTDSFSPEAKFVVFRHSNTATGTDTCNNLTIK